MNQIVPAQPLLPSKDEWAFLKEQAQMAVKSGLLPRAVDSPEKATIIALKGRELGIPPMQAFSHIHVVDGKPTMSAELMLAQIYKHCAGAVINYLQSDDKRCVIEASRPGHKLAQFAYTIEEAQKAGLLGKHNWKAYPAAMLRARAIAIVARAVFPDAIMGVSYTPEELGAETNDEGDVIVIPPSSPKPDSQPDKIPAAAASPSTSNAAAAPTPPRSRKDIGLAIVAAGNELGMQPPELEKHAEEMFKKGVRELSTAEMETFLGELEAEIGRRSVSA